MSGIFCRLMNFFGIRAVADELSVFDRDPLPGVFIPVICQPLSVGCEIAQASVLRQTVDNVFSLARARLTFSRMSEALVQTNGLGSEL